MRLAGDAVALEPVSLLEQEGTILGRWLVSEARG